MGLLKQLTLTLALAASPTAFGFAPRAATSTAGSALKVRDTVVLATEFHGRFRRLTTQPMTHFSIFY